MKRKLLHGFLGAVVLFTSMVLLAVLAGAKFNLSRSCPLGLYWDTRTRAKKNDLVFFHPTAYADF
jgi:type IV secretory pathway protease TraF